MSSASQPKIEVRGKYISLEGRDGVGKTTIMPYVAERLKAALGEERVVLTREPGGTKLGQELRELLLHSKENNMRPSSRAEVLLFAADNAHHAAHIVKPALERGQWVLGDRSLGSALAYQGFGRGWPIETMRNIYSWAIDDCIPDLTILLDCEDSVANERLILQGEEPDNIEASGREFFERVRDGYRELADTDPAWAVVDCTYDIETVAESCWKTISDKLC